MSNKIEELINQLSLIPNITKKTAEKISFNLIKDKENFKLILNNIDHLLGDIYQDELTKEIKTPDSNEDIDTSILYIFETNKDSYNFLNKIGGKNAQFIIDFEYKNEFTNIDSINLLMSRLIKYIIKIQPKEIIIVLPPKPETELFFRIVKEKLLDEDMNDIVVSKLATGIPFNGSVEYLDEYTIKKALEKRGEK